VEWKDAHQEQGPQSLFAVPAGYGVEQIFQRLSSKKKL
jgi:hypothetical protein